MQPANAARATLRTAKRQSTPIATRRPDSQDEPDVLKLIVCPECEAEFRVAEDQWANGEIESGQLVCEGEAHRYRIRHFVPRFVDTAGYTDPLTLEWTAFRNTHLSGAFYIGTKPPIDRRWAETKLAARTSRPVETCAG